jgi:hypothetical protein
MRKVSRHPSRNVMLGLALLAAAAGPVFANDNNFYQSNTQYGVSLPNASLPSGADEVRAADGTSCRSAVGGDGAYLDVGIIGAPGRGGSSSSGAIYSRFVMPLGAKPKRLNCASLYELEIQRLKMELELARMGLSGQAPASAAAPAAWQDEGWSNEGTAPAPKAHKKKKNKVVESVADTQPLAVVVAEPVVETLY